MSQVKYDFPKIEVQFMESDFVQLAPFFRSIGMKLTSRVREVATNENWIAKKKQRNREACDAHIKEFFKKKGKLIKKSLRKTLYLTNRGLALMVERDDPNAKALEKYWQMLRTEAGLPIRHVKQHIDLQEFDAESARNEIDNQIKNGSTPKPVAIKKGSRKTLRKRRAKKKAKS